MFKDILKYNKNHSPHDGRFTSGPGGAGAADESKIVNNIPTGAGVSNEQKLAAIAKLTAENKPLVDAFLKATDEELGTQSKSNVKGDKQILEKAQRPSIVAEKPWHNVEHLRDTFRFKTVLNNINDLPEIAQNFTEAGWQVVKVDTKKLLQPKAWGWRAVMLDMRMPNGQLVEYYMPLRELEAAKDAGHKIFEVWRNHDVRKLSRSQRRQRELDIRRSYKLYEDAFRAALRRNGQKETDVRAALAKFEAIVASSTAKKASSSTAVKANGGESVHLSAIFHATKPSVPATKTMEPSGEMETRSASDMAAASGFKNVLKYNPNHDPRNGQFTSGPGGTKRPELSEADMSASFQSMSDTGMYINIDHDFLRGQGYDPDDYESEYHALGSWWHDNVSKKVPPEELVKGWIGEDSYSDSASNYRIEVPDPDGYGNSMAFLSEEGTMYGAMHSDYIRRLDFDEGRVVHEYLELHDQGTGAARAAFTAVLPIYKDMGLDHVYVHAGLSMGPYVWAKYGFRHEDDYGATEQISFVRSRLQEFLDTPGLTSLKAKAEVETTIKALDRWAEKAEANGTLSDSNYFLSHLKMPAADEEYRRLYSVTFAGQTTKHSLISRSMVSDDWYGKLYLQNSDFDRAMLYATTKGTVAGTHEQKPAFGDPNQMGFDFVKPKRKPSPADFKTAFNANMEAPRAFETSAEDHVRAARNIMRSTGGGIINKPATLSDTLLIRSVEYGTTPGAPHTMRDKLKGYTPDGLHPLRKPTETLSNFDSRARGFYNDRALASTTTRALAKQTRSSTGERQLSPHDAKVKLADRWNKLSRAILARGYSTTGGLIRKPGESLAKFEARQQKWYAKRKDPKDIREMIARMDKIGAALNLATVGKSATAAYDKFGLGKRRKKPC